MINLFYYKFNASQTDLTFSLKVKLNRVGVGLLNILGSCDAPLKVYFFTTMGIIITSFLFVNKNFFILNRYATK